MPYNITQKNVCPVLSHSCALQRFQDVEDCHLTRLLHMVREFVRVLGSSNDAVMLIQQDMQLQFGQHSVLSLLDGFALNRHTGLEKPSNYAYFNGVVLMVHFINLSVFLTVFFCITDNILFVLSSSNYYFDVFIFIINYFKPQGAIDRHLDRNVRMYRNSSL